MMKLTTAALILFLSLASSSALAQSGATRPRRTVPVQPTPSESEQKDNASTPATASTSTSTRAPNPSAPANASDTSKAFALLQQKSYDAALKEAQRIAASDPKNAEAWKIAGFANFNLKKYPEAAADLQRALDLQRAAKEEDVPTIDALAQSYVRSEKFEQALPLLVAATTRKDAKPDPFMLYYRGLAEYRTNRIDDAERSFNEAIKADAKNSAALFYLGRIAFDKKNLDAAINFLNRATMSDARLTEAWTLLTYAYLQRADAAGTGPKAEADYQSAVRASESLIRARSDEPAITLHAQALIRTQDYARAATALERVAANPDASGQTLYLLGFSYSRGKNFPKAIAALERAAAKTPDDANIYRELGYVYEATKQYSKALNAYQKGLSLAPDDAYFKEASERVRPFAK